MVKTLLSNEPANDEAVKTASELLAGMSPRLYLSKSLRAWAIQNIAAALREQREKDAAIALGWAAKCGDSTHCLDCENIAAAIREGDA